jgi:hypothetical protein
MHPEQPLRRRVELASQPWLERLADVPKLLVAGLVGIGVLVALLVDNRWSALAIPPVLAFLAWLTYLSWPRLDPLPRVLRLLVLVGMTLWAGARVLG